MQRSTREYLGQSGGGEADAHGGVEVGGAVVDEDGVGCDFTALRDSDGGKLQWWALKMWMDWRDSGWEGQAERAKAGFG